MTHTPKDEGRDFDGAILRIFDAGHQFETLSIRWLRGAGFDLRTKRADGGQFGFEAAGGKLRGHIDGVIIAGPDVGLRWPALWEHKALNAKSWNDLVKHGLTLSKPVYFAQVQLYMGYLELETALVTALNKDTGIRMVGSQRRRLLFRLRRFSEERECHRAENGRFPRSGLAVDAEETGLDRITKVDDDALRVGTERLKGEPDRSHSASSVSRSRLRAAATTSNSASESRSSRTCSRKSPMTSIGFATARVRPPSDLISGARSSRS